MTAWAAPIVAPPAKTAKRANASASGALRRRWLQSIVARRVRWRSGASRGPPPRTSSVSGQPGVQLLGVEHCRARGRQLDRERQPVETATDLGDSAGVVHAQLELSVVAARALEEQRAGRGLLDRCRLALRWHRQRGHRVTVLRPQSQTLAAGRQHLQRRAGGQQIAHQGRRREQMLEVVEHEQTTLGGEGALQSRPRGLAL